MKGSRSSDSVPAARESDPPPGNLGDGYMDSSEASSPPEGSSPADADRVPSSTSAKNPATSTEDLPHRALSFRSVSDPPTMPKLGSTRDPGSTVAGTLNQVRGVRSPIASSSTSGLPPELLQKTQAFFQSRQNMSRPALSAQSSPGSNDSRLSGLSGGASALAGLRLPSQGSGAPMKGGMTFPSMGGGGIGARPVPPSFPQSAPVVPVTGGKKPSLSERRAMKLGGLPGTSPGAPPSTPKLSDMSGPLGDAAPSINGEGRGSKLSDFKNYIDTEKGWVTFEGAATITRHGVDFANGQTFSISLDEVDVLDELGKGNYGTVYKVRHARPKAPRFGQGLSGFKVSRRTHMSSEQSNASSATTDGRSTSGRIMAMKELRLELDEAKFGTILKELVILHECSSPYIIDFYGAFFQEGAVYMCIEYMDGGSIDKLYAGGIPENVLRKIAYATIMGLKSLKDDHNIIHRDVKPTNILANTQGQVKICDFGVSGNLVASIAKTNIGCQSYMAPERISGGGMAAPGGASNGTYCVQSDIWSLGLTIIECAMGKYPYPPEVSSTIFSQLNAIVEGEPPDLPAEGYSTTARDFVRACLNKNPSKRHTYPMLLTHPWIKALTQPETISEDAETEDVAAGDALADAADSLDIHYVLGDREAAMWVQARLRSRDEDRSQRGDTVPALHKAPLDAGVRT